MKKALWIPALIVLFLIGDRLGALVFENATQRSKFRYARLYSGKADADILLLGNSRGLIFFQPHIEEITGKRTLNLSYNALPVDLAKVLVQDYYTIYSKAELLLIDVTLCDRINKQLITGFTSFSTYSNNLDQLIKQQSPNSWYASKISHLYRYNSEIFQRTLYYLERSDEDWLLDRVISPSLIQNVNEEPVVELETNDYLLKELAALVNLAERNGTEVRLLINPYYPDYIKRMENLPHFIEKIKQATGKEVYNYSSALSQTEGFGDYQHLNKTGSRQFLNLLKEDGIFDNGKDQLSRMD